MVLKRGVRLKKMSWSLFVSIFLFLPSLGPLTSALSKNQKNRAPMPKPFLVRTVFPDSENRSGKPKPLREAKGKKPYIQPKPCIHL